MALHKKVDAKGKIVGCTLLPEEAELSTDISSSEDANSSECARPSPAQSPSSRVKVQWSDLVDSRMLAREEADKDESKNQQVDISNLAAPVVPRRNEAAASTESPEEAEGLEGKRRPRRRRRHLKGGTAADASAVVSRPEESMSHLYPSPHKFAGLSTHCNKLSSPVARGGRNVVTVNDILGSFGLTDVSSSPQASFSVSSTATIATTPAMATCTMPQACPQATLPNPWMEPACEAGSRTAWYTPMVTEWNPPYWESPVYAPGNQVDHGEQLNAWLMASGLPSCKNDLTEQLYAVAPEAYED